MLLRSFLGSLALLSLVLLVNACSSSAPTREVPSLHLTAVDSRTGETLDSAKIWNRRTGDTTQVQSGNSYELRTPSPALYVFDVDGYGFHRHRHFSVLVEPDDKSIAVNVPLRPMQLTINCQSARALYREDLNYAVNRDTNGVRLRLINTLARNGQVQFQPAVVNNLNVPVFVPDNFGSWGHYSIRLVDEEGASLPFEYEEADSSLDHRIYSKSNIQPVVPGETERLQRTTVTLKKEIKEGATIYAHMEYDFSRSDTLRTTAATTFPPLRLDSLHHPLYDTLRVTGEIQAADSLVLKRDTTVTVITGIDTTVTRDGYLLYSTYRDSNATRTAEAARSLLFVPDSVKKRARRDSLDADPLLASMDPDSGSIDLPFPSEPILHAPPQVVYRSNRPRLDSLLTDSRLVEALSHGLPGQDVPVDSLLGLSKPLRETYFTTPKLPKKKIYRGIDTTSSSSITESTSPHGPPEPSPSLGLPPEGDSTSRLIPSPAPDSIPIDSLALTIPAEADSFVVDSVGAASLSAPPPHTYWYVPDSLTTEHSPVMIVDSTFGSLRARPHVDTTYTRLEHFLPERIGQPDSSVVHRVPQQVLIAPTGGYRPQYLRTWTQVQQRNLRPHYCRIYPYSLETLWRTAAMH